MSGININERIEAKLDSINKDIQEIKVTQAKQHVTLEEHQKRSLANEQAVELLSEGLKPVHNQYIIISFCVKVLTVLVGSGAVVALIEVIMKGSHV